MSNELYIGRNNVVARREAFINYFIKSDDDDDGDHGTVEHKEEPAKGEPAEDNDQ